MGDPLRNLSNARLLPHLASRTESAVEAMGWVVRDVMAVLPILEQTISSLNGLL